MENAIERFKEPQMSDCRETAVNYELSIEKTYSNILEMSSDQMTETLKFNRCFLIKIIENMQYFFGQGQAILADKDVESNFFQLIKLRGRDDNRLVDWLKRKLINIQAMKFRTILSKSWHINSYETLLKGHRGN